MHSRCKPKILGGTERRDGGMERRRLRKDQISGPDGEMFLQTDK